MNSVLLFQLGLLTLLTVQADNINENDIIQLKYLDTSIDPCDNFYQFTCGNFQNVHPRPENVEIVDHFTLLENEMIQIGYEILSSPKSNEDPQALKKAKSAYKACVDSEYDDGLVPELRTIVEFGGLPLLSSKNHTIVFSWEEIGDLVGKYGVPLIFNYNIIQMSPNESLINMNPDTMPNPSLFRPKHLKTYDDIMEESLLEFSRSRTKRSVNLAPFDIFLRTLAKNLLKYTNPNKPDDEMISDLDDMATFMRSLYSGGILDGNVLPLEEFPPTLGQLQKWTNLQFGHEIINWVSYFNKIFQIAGVTITENTKLNHQGVDKIFGVLNLVNQTDPKIIKNFALFRVFLFQAPDSDNVTRQSFEDYYKAKNYPLYPRWEYCTRKILDVVDTASLNYAVTYDYQRYHYNINKIPKAVEMIANIRKAFEEILIKSDWMDNESRDLALKKAENMLVLLAYPDFVNNKTTLDRFYENIRICEWDNYGNSRNIRAFKQAYQFTQLGSPERTFWGKSTFDPNAYYNRPNNKIVIPIAMLNPIFFYGDNAILDYSRLGSIIGHEITHGFDSNGKNYDENGGMSSWWTKYTVQAFANKSQCFKDQYSSYYVNEIDAYVNGSLCINENLADNGGVRESFKAFMKLTENGSFNVTGPYSLEQLFFIGYGTMWCSNESENYLKTMINRNNGYAPNRFRVIGALSNMEEFSDAFNCALGSNMNPKNKCLLW